MTIFLYYILKVSICSGILTSYYLIALRNKQFHQWNRFYLILTVLISLIIPVIHLPFLEYVSTKQRINFPLLGVVQSANNYLDEVTITKYHSISLDQWFLFGYALISFLLFIPFISSLVKISGIIKRHTIQYFNRIKFLNTKVPGTPFSFFNYIFWNEAIDIKSESGKQIFQHELIHVAQKHTIDKLFIQIILLPFWFNPFFWFIRKELNAVHEFIADQKSLINNDTGKLATMILQAAHPSKFNLITNQFFQSSIKRRLIMLNKSQTPKISFLSRSLALPILLITFMAFTLKSKLIYSPLASLDNAITVVIDAGHGVKDGKKTGAMSENIYEDDITLSIAQTIKKLNNDKNLNIILTRSSDENIDLRTRVDIANENHADLFISIHVNAAQLLNSGDKNMDTKLDGMEVVISKNNTSNQEASRKLGSVIVSELSSAYKINQQLQVYNTGIWVLDKSPRPSVLIECGYLTNEKDRQFISGADNQKLIAQKILSAIKLYAISANESNGFQNMKSTEIDRSKISISTKDTSKTDPLLVIDGKIIGRLSKYKDRLNTKADNINSIYILKDEPAIKKYGNKGKEGVIEIISKDPSKPLLEKKEIENVNKIGFNNEPVLMDRDIDNKTSSDNNFFHTKTITLIIDKC